MASRAVHSWTLADLILAFLDLAIAYVLLCGSACAFILSKFLSVSGFFLPCPCTGLLGYQNNDLCLHKLLIDWPTSKIYHVHALVKSRFPFDLIWFADQSSDLHVEGVRDRKRENGVVELEGEGCSTSLSGPRLSSCVDGESGYDAKGKKATNQKHKSGIRRRRRAALGYGKFLSALSTNSTRSIGLGASHSSHDSSGEMGSQISGNLGLASGTEDGILGDGHGPIVIDHGSFELNGSYKKGKGIRKNASFVANMACNAEDVSDSVGNDAIKMVGQSLEEEKTALAALYQELEKERAAAASAADEAMAMIMRLQEDKASIAMEARQYQRMIEEKFAYDDEEMDILKEIVVRRELENHFLEKKLEAYQLMNISGNEQLKEDSSCQMNNTGKRPPLSSDSDENLLLLPQQMVKSKTIFQKEVQTNARCSSNDERSHTLALGNEMMPECKESASDSSTSEGVLQKTVCVAGEEKTQRYVGEISQTCGGMEEEMGKDRNHLNQVGSCMHSPMLDTELTVYDVHVVDDETTVWKEGGGKESGPLSSAPSDFEVCTTSELSDCPRTSVSETEPNGRGSHLDTTSSLPRVGDSQCKILDIDSHLSSSSAVNSERFKIDSEVECLRERLRTVQEEKDKLTISAEHKDRVSAQLKLVEEIISQLRETHQLREPMRQASLPPLSSKVR
uniref:GTD-binding domain-containing protein n=1 Tax=Salix viminalis TaxID=40686 RepID=A0A6N2MXU5_SALVM